MRNMENRSYQKELLDGDTIPFPEIKRNMEELNTINTLLGGHAITVKGFKNLVGRYKKITVCEIGCGGGDNLVAIVKWCHAHEIEVRCIGIDIKKECIDVAGSVKILEGNSDWIINDFAVTQFSQKPDIIFSSLFCHHFTNEELVEQLQWMQANSRIGFFINDLHRHWVAYYSIGALTKIFSSSRLVKNDAPLSVARGFLKTDWLLLFQKAGIRHFQITWQWAFRHLIISKHDAKPSI